MITELFLNSCFSLVFSNHRKAKKEIFRDILNIICYVEKTNKLDIPVIVKTKVDCLKEICKLKLDDREDDNIIDSIFASKKFDSMIDYIEAKRMEKNNDLKIEDHINQVKLKRKFVDLFPNYDNLNHFMELAKNGNFDSLDVFIKEYEGISREMYSNLMRSNRLDDVEIYSSLDLVNDDFTPAVELIKSKYDSKNTVPTGFKVLDEDVFNGGFAKSRLYIFGGGSGSGKSTLMLNCFQNQITGIRSDGIPIDKLMDLSKNSNEPEVYLYITLENQIDESLLRMYQAQFGRTEVAALRHIEDGLKVKKELGLRIRKNAIPVLKYRKKHSIGVIDIMGIVDDVENQYGKGSIKCLYVDYLDLLKGDSRYDLYRLELGLIAEELKDLAVEYNMPVVSGSQLNRSIYGSNDSRSFNLGMMSESMKKVDVSDFISLMLKDSTDDKLVHMKVGKNRSGISDLTIDFNVNFKIYKFLNGFKSVTNQQKQIDQKLDNKASFLGFGDAGF